ncbi:MAG: AsmA-like C-terminal domain-containing protein [Deltaproteobacteria bacterium]|nr:MAG: AsmA-like C-terminal domain-containing protein [Deltaproteobacteria bacterium]
MKAINWKKASIIVLVVIAVVFIASALIIPRLIDPNQYHGLITVQVEKAVGGKVTLGRLSWGIADGIWVEADGITIEGATVFHGDLDLSRIYAKVSILPLLSRKVALKELLLERPVITVRVGPSPAQEKSRAKSPEIGAPEKQATDDTASLSDPAQTHSPLPVEVLIEELRVRQGRIALKDSLTLPGQEMIHVFVDVEIRATDVTPGREMAFQVALRDEANPGFGLLEGEGTFAGLTRRLTFADPELKLKATISSLHTDILKPYLKDHPLARRMGGSISLKVNCESDLARRLRASGHIDLTRFTYTDPSFWEETIGGMEAMVTYQVSLDPKRIGVENINLTMGNLALSAQGQLENWQEKLVVKKGVLSSDLPLMELIPLVPWGQLGKEAESFGKAFSRGGKVVIDKAVLPEFEPTDLPTTWKTLLSRTEASIRVSGISVRPSPELPKIENITGTLALEKAVLTATKLTARVGPLTLPTLRVKATNLTHKPKVTVNAKGPMRLSRTTDVNVEKLLKRYGLKRLSGTAEIDMSARYDQARPENWRADGYLMLAAVSGATHPAGVRLDNLKGRVTLKRRKALEISVDGLMGRINQSPIQLDGKLSGGGTPQAVVNGTTRTEGLDLADLRALFPPLEELRLVGKLDMDIEVHYPRAHPKKSRIKGTVRTQGMGIRLAAQDITVTNGDADLKFTGDTVEAKRISLKVNDQRLIVLGRVTNFVEPKGWLQVSSPSLNLDRLLPPATRNQTRSKSSSALAERKATGSKKGVPTRQKAELPPFVRKLTAQLSVEATQGQYRGQGFNDLRFKGQYERGVLRNYQFEILMAGGRMAARGSADLRSLERIPFTVEPSINGVRLEALAPLFGIDKVSARGPLRLTGLVQGRTGSTQDLFGSLRGDLEAEVGRGRIHDIGYAGSVFSKMLAFINIQGLISGRLGSDLGGEGMPFDSVEARASFGGGYMRVGNLRLEGPTLNVDAQGTVDLVNQQLNMKADLETLGIADNVLNLVPVLGQAGQMLSRVGVNVQGSVENPKISVRPSKRVAGGEEQDKAQNSRDALEGVFKSFGKGFEKMLQK